MAKEYSYGICPYQIMNGSFYILLNKTSKQSFFNFFKGKMEKGETIEECAIREFYEETGVLVQKKDLEEYFYQKGNRKNIGIFLLDWSKYQSYPFTFQEKEIWSASWVPVMDNVEASKNQQKILNSIILFFKPKISQLRRIYSFNN
jgi:8-oxo-dGTP pyrophosphatase MutT (NUDIX family)